MLNIGAINRGWIVKIINIIIKNEIHKYIKKFSLNNNIIPSIISIKIFYSKISNPNYFILSKKNKFILILLNPNFFSI